MSMIRKRKLLIFSVIIIITFFTSTNYLLRKLASTQDEVRTIQEKIYLELDKLPSFYNTRQPLDHDVFDSFLTHLRSTAIKEDVNTLWKVANSWISKTQLVDFTSSTLGSVLSALAKTKIIKADLDTRGTQLKLLLTLKGQQDVIFKPKWYDIDKIIEGPVYAGKDRHSSEIVAFYLSAILNMPFTPCSVARTISFSQEVLSVATKQLINSSFENGNRSCIYGKCFYCNRNDPVCEDEKSTVDGTVIFNINSPLKSYKSPWQRTYKKNRKAVWESDDNYCNYVKEKLTRRRLLDLVDVSIFDFLIQNGDRHHYETLYDSVVFLDNGKGFGNPNMSYLDILAPLYQCCTIRNATLKKLLNVADGNLRKRLEAIPNIENFITVSHINGIEKRLLIIFACIEYCKNINKIK